MISEYFGAAVRQMRKLAAKDVSTTWRTVADSDEIIARWWEAKPNWGDALNPVLVEHLSGKCPISYRKVVNVANRPVYSVIGSMLDGSRVRNLVVWGSGFMHENSTFRVPPRRIHAVRGPLTRRLILRQGISCPEVYGDPALLYPLFYKPQAVGNYKLGIVPHFQDRSNALLERFRGRSDIMIIDILGGVEAVVDQIASCETIASSSLHGLIAADAYGVPSRWIKFSDKVRGKGFKFRDYFASVNRPAGEPLVVDEHTSLQQILDGCYGSALEFDLDPLLESCPFNRLEHTTSQLTTDHPH